jgi:hypothetical protein
MARAARGEVYLPDIRTRIGFIADRASAGLPVVVVQGNAPNSVLETPVVVPLVAARLPRPVALSRLRPVPVARVSSATLRFCPDMAISAATPGSEARER